jgi:succinyl-CoA synthetase beta subunit
MKCDIISNGIIQAVQKVGVNIPIVIRLTGTNSKEGLQIYMNSL